MSVEHTGESNGYHYFKYKLSDQYEGSLASKKNQSFLSQGDMIEYEEAKFGNGNNKLKDVKKVDQSTGNVNQPEQNQSAPQNRNSNEVQTYITRQSSLQRALEFCSQNGIKPDLHTVCATAEVLTNYVLNGNIPAKKHQNPVTGQPTTGPETDDLPF